MTLHLASSYGFTKEYPEGGLQISRVSSESSIVAALGCTISAGVQINSDIFKQMLIRWTYVTNTPFYAVEDSTFCILLHYLLSCVCNIYFFILNSYH